MKGSKTTPTLGDGPWMTRAEIARHHGQARSTITRRVEALKATGRLRTKTGSNGGELIDLACFDQETAQTIDGIRSEAHARRKKMPAAGNVRPPPDLAYDNARLEAAGYNILVSNFAETLSEAFVAVGAAHRELLTEIEMLIALEPQEVRAAVLGRAITAFQTAMSQAAQGFLRGTT